MSPMNRRSLLMGFAGTALAGASAQLAEASEPAHPPKSQPDRPLRSQWRYCLNTSTVRAFDGKGGGKSRTILELIDIAAKAGYDAIEPWIVELEAYVSSGGSLKDLGKRIQDAGLAVPDVIGFAEWVVDDLERRKKGLEQARRDMDMVAQIGGQRIAAPPVGATGGKSPRDDPRYTQPVDPLTAAERYRTLLELGQAMGVTPIVEIWGFSKTLSRLGEAFFVAAECGRPNACILPDIYHLFKGGSDFTGLALLSSQAIGIVHVNDYPAGKERAVITDADRVYPGDGIAPWKEILNSLHTIGYRGYLSLELFNRDYWKQDPHHVARTGLEKLKSLVANI